MLITEQGASISLIRRFMDFCQMPATPPLNIALVDVRDVARAHLEAMRRPETDGERILVGRNAILVKNIILLVSTIYFMY